MVRKTLRASYGKPRRQRELEVLSNFRQLYRATSGLLIRPRVPGGVSGSQLRLLRHVAATPGLRVSELARALAVRPSTASNLLLRLERQGLIRRKRRGTDRREVGVYLTPRGLTTSRGSLPEDRLSRLDRSLAQLPGPVLDRLDGSLAALLHLIGDTLGEGRGARNRAPASRAD